MTLESTYLKVYTKCYEVNLDISSERNGPLVLRKLSGKQFKLVKCWDAIVSKIHSMKRVLKLVLKVVLSSVSFQGNKSKIQKGCRLYLMIGLLKTHLDMISNSMCFSFTKLREAIFSILFNKLNTTQMNLPLYFAAKSVVCDVRKSCAYQLSTNIYHIP